MTANESGATAGVVEPKPATEAVPPIRRRRRISLVVALTTSIGALLVVSTATVLAIGIWSGRENTLKLLGDYAQQTITSAVDQIEQHVGAAEQQVQYLSRLVEGEKSRRIVAVQEVQLHA